MVEGLKQINITVEPPESLKKLKVNVIGDDFNRNIKIGDRRYEDFTIHKDEERKAKYIQRHSKNREKYGLNGILTAGFYSRWLLWEEPTLLEAAKKLSEYVGAPIFLNGKEV